MINELRKFLHRSLPILLDAVAAVILCALMWPVAFFFLAGIVVAGMLACWILGSHPVPPASLVRFLGVAVQGRFLIMALALFCYQLAQIVDPTVVTVADPRLVFRGDPLPLLFWIAGVLTAVGAGQIEVALVLAGAAIPPRTVATVLRRLAAHLPEMPAEKVRRRATFWDELDKETRREAA